MAVMCIFERDTSTGLATRLPALGVTLERQPRGGHTRNALALEHRAEKWEPVFCNNDAKTNT